MLDVAVTVSTCVSPPPTAIPVRFTVCAPASSKIAAGSVIAVIVGASFNAVTVTVKVCVVVATPLLSVPPLSVTVTVMTAVPLALATGV